MLERPSPAVPYTTALRIRYAAPHMSEALDRNGARRKARRRAPVALLLTASLLAPAPAAAQTAARAHGAVTTTAATVSPEAQNAARAHYQKARELYQAGSYREAITELEAALALDPGGKDLVFNLVLVHEKLGNIDDALRYLRRYEEMDLEPQERSRADSYIKRLEGAKREVKVDDHPGTPPPPPQQPTPAQAAPSHGRFDVLTAIPAALALGGIIVGVTFGALAVSENPPNNGKYVSYSAYVAQQQKATSAHQKAQIADVAFIGAGVMALTSAALFFLRTKEKDTSTRQSIFVSATPLPSGGGAFVGGSF